MENRICEHCKKTKTHRGIDGMFLCYGCRDELNAEDYDKWREEQDALQKEGEQHGN